MLQVICRIQQCQRLHRRAHQFGFANENNTDNGSIHRLRSANSLGKVVVTSVTGYNRYQRNQNEDCDGLQARICQTHDNAISHQFSQELRAFADLSGVRLTAGAYFLRHKIVLNNIAPLYLNTPTPIAIVIDGQQVSKSYAVRQCRV